MKGDEEYLSRGPKDGKRRQESLQGWIFPVFLTFLTSHIKLLGIGTVWYRNSIGIGTIWYRNSIVSVSAENQLRGSKAAPSVNEVTDEKMNGSQVRARVVDRCLQCGCYGNYVARGMLPSNATSPWAHRGVQFSASSSGGRILVKFSLRKGCSEGQNVQREVLDF